MNELKTLT